MQPRTVPEGLRYLPRTEAKRRRKHQSTGDKSPLCRVCPHLRDSPCRPAIRGAALRENLSMNYLITAVLCVTLILVLAVAAAATALFDVRRALSRLRIRRKADF